MYTYAGYRRLQTCRSRSRFDGSDASILVDRRRRLERFIACALLACRPSCSCRPACSWPGLMAASWQKTSRLHAANVHLGGALDSSKARLGMNEADAADVVFEVSGKGELKTVDKYHQADASMHTLTAWETRMHLRRTKEVRAALHLWWSTILRTTAGTSLDKPSYLAVYRLLFKALAKESGDKYDEEEALECAEEDWANDSADGESVPREAFLGSLFQIADLYTDFANAQDYCSFLLRVLKRCLAKGTAPTNKIPTLEDDWSKGLFWKTKKQKQPAAAKAPPPAAVVAAKPEPEPEPAAPKPPTPKAEPAQPPEPAPKPAPRRAPPPAATPALPAAPAPAARKPLTPPQPSPVVRAPAPAPAPAPVAPPPKFVRGGGNALLSSVRKAKFLDADHWKRSGMGGEEFNDLDRMDWSNERDGAGRPEGGDRPAWAGSGRIERPSEEFMDWGAESDAPKPKESPAWYGGAVVNDDPRPFLSMDTGVQDDDDDEPAEPKPKARERRKERRRAQKQGRATCKVQARCRTKIERKKFAVTKQATCTLQASMRRMSAMRVMAAARRAAICIQKRLRGLRARKALKPKTPERVRTPLPEGWLDWLEDRPPPSTREAGWLARPVARANGLFARLPTSLRASQSSLRASQSSPLVAMLSRPPQRPSALLDVLPVQRGVLPGPVPVPVQRDVLPVQRPRGMHAAASSTSMPALPTFPRPLNAPSRPLDAPTRGVLAAAAREQLRSTTRATGHGRQTHAPIYQQGTTTRLADGGRGGYPSRSAVRSDGRHESYGLQRAAHASASGSLFVDEYGTRLEAPSARARYMDDPRLVRPLMPYKKPFTSPSETLYASLRQPAKASLAQRSGAFRSMWSSSAGPLLSPVGSVQTWSPLQSPLTTTVGSPMTLLPPLRG